MFDIVCFLKAKIPKVMHLSKRPLKCLYIYIFFLRLKEVIHKFLSVHHKTLKFRFHSHTFLFLELTDASKIIACLSVNLIVSLSEYSLTEIAHHVMHLFLEKYYILMCCITLVMTNLVYYTDLPILYYNKTVYNDYNPHIAA